MRKRCGRDEHSSEGAFQDGPVPTYWKGSDVTGGSNPGGSPAAYLSACSSTPDRVYPAGWLRRRRPPARRRTTGSRRNHGGAPSGTRARRRRDRRRGSAPRGPGPPSPPRRAPRRSAGGRVTRKAAASSSHGCLQSRQAPLPAGGATANPRAAALSRIRSSNDRTREATVSSRGRAARRWEPAMRFAASLTVLFPRSSIRGTP